MKTLVFDLETFSLCADTGIILCCSYKPYDKPGPVKVIRADQFKEWKDNRSNSRPICEKIIEEFYDYDIFVAHNGMRFDKKMIVSFALKYDLRLFLRFAKFIDPCDTARRHLKLSRNSLEYVADFLGIRIRKTPIHWELWRKAAYEGNSGAMDDIAHHCNRDVLVLDKVHNKMRRLIKDVNDRGSSF